MIPIVGKLQVTYLNKILNTFSLGFLSLIPIKVHEFKPNKELTIRPNLAFILTAILLLQVTLGISQTSPGLITNISATSGRSYILGELVTGVTFYTDRTYVTTSVPTNLNNEPFIKTANDDKTNNTASLLSFTVNQNATVYVAYDPRATALPAWLASFQKLTGQQIGVNDSKISYMQLYSKSYPAGTVNLGGNLQSPAAGALNNYFVIVEPQAATGRLSVSPLKIYDNDVAGSPAGINRTVTVKNTGSGILSLSSVNTSGTNINQFILSGLPAFPKNINAGDSISFSVAFNPSTIGLKTAIINVNSDDASNPAVSVSVRGLGTSGLGGANEPSLQSLLNLLEIQTNVGDDDSSTAVINSNTTLQKAALLGDEISVQKFQKAGSGNVTIRPLAVFGPTDSSTIVAMGWYNSGNASVKSELISISNDPVSNGQTVNVNYTGTSSFDPFNNAFGFYSRWPYFNNRHLYSEDSLNTFSGSIPHHVRIYPYKKNGVLVPNSYLVAFEEHISGFDYQDIVFIVENVKPASISPIATTVTILPLADAFIRNGTYANSNYGKDTSLLVKTYTTAGVTRMSYLKFALNVSKVRSAKLRLYGRNTESTASIALSSFGVDNDTWSETGINFNNAPAALTSNKLSSVSINNQAKYYELDVTDFVKFQLAGDKVASFLIKDPANGNKTITINSKENSQNPPQLVIDTTTVALSNASLFVENPDLFPSNDNFVFSRIQIPWTRDSVYNANHDSLKVRIRSKGINPLVISNLSLSNDSAWKIDKLNGVTYFPGSGLPVSITTGNYIDVTLKFIAKDQAVRVKVLHETLTITSNDDKSPLKTVYLHGLWQKSGEGSHEPYSQEILNAFGLTTKVGFAYTDPDLGDSTKLKGDEIKPSYFLLADSSTPVTIRQMAAYHGCCQSTEKLQWYIKGSSTMNTVVTHISKDGQTLLPRSGTSGTPASGSINTSAAFGFRIGSVDWTDATKTPGNKIGIRVWKAFDLNGNIIANTYIIANDYLGSSATNYDYNDNMYYITNIKPQSGANNFSTLNSTPSALDFGQEVVQSNDSLQFNIKNLGQTYADGSSDPAIKISSIDITGENRFEFSASLPATTTLNVQQTLAITVKFKPVTQGLKIADLLIYYNNSSSPLRVPLYGIGKAADSTVVVNYRIKSGSSASVNINGKTWSADTAYAFDNLEPYTNPKVKQITATDEDGLYFTEQSSDGDKKPFRYEMPLPNGNYVVRLHFAEVYWGTAGSSGGAGSRVMSVKLENQFKLVNLDIVQEAGSASALIKNIPVTVTDGELNIDFSASVNRPSVSAIEVYSFTGASSRPPVLSRVALQPTISVAPYKSLRVFPNPVKSTFSIEFPDKYNGNTSIQIIDILGKKYQVAHTKLIGERSVLKVDISSLSLNSGIYFLKVDTEGKKSEVIKLVVQ